MHHIVSCFSQCFACFEDCESILSLNLIIVYHPTEWYDVWLVTGVYYLIQSRIIGTFALLSMSWLWNKKYINILINWINVGENRRVKQSRDTDKHKKQDEDEQNKNNTENYKY